MDLTLRYFRFATGSVTRSIEFWEQCLKMHLHRQTESLSGIRCVFQFPGDVVGLRFENDFSRKVKSRARGGAAATVTTSQSAAYVVVYVDSVSEVLKRVRAGGFHVIIDEMPVNDTVRAAAVCLDPNGLRVRLMEAESFKIAQSRSHGRLAYVVAPVRDAQQLERACEFYESTFARAAAATHTSRIKRALESKWEPLSSRSGAAARRNDSSFRVVDSERFVDDVASFVWLSNHARHKAPALCLLHKLVRRAPALPASAAPPLPQFATAAGGAQPLSPAAQQALQQAPQQLSHRFTGAGAGAAAGAAASAAAAGATASLDSPPGSPLGGGAGGAGSRRTMLGRAPSVETKTASTDSAGDAHGGPAAASSPKPGGIGESKRSSLFASALARSAGASSSSSSSVAAAVAAAAATDKKGAGGGAGEDIFLGPSFSVADLEYVVKVLKDKDSAFAASSARLDVQQIPGFPRYVAFFDPAGLPVEISDGVLSAAPKPPAPEKDAFVHS